MEVFGETFLFRFTGRKEKKTGKSSQHLNKLHDPTVVKTRRCVRESAFSNERKVCGQTIHLHSIGRAEFYQYREGGTN